MWAELVGKRPLRQADTGQGVRLGLPGEERSGERSSKTEVRRCLSEVERAGERGRGGGLVRI